MNNNSTCVDVVRSVSDGKLYDQFTEDIPGFIYLLSLFIIGTIGNIHVLVVYYKRKRSCLREIILTLSSVDLFACLISIPHDLVDIRYNTNVRYAFSCTLFMYLDYMVTLSSVSLLTILSVERSMMICRPFTSVLTPSQTRCINFISVFFCGLVSMPCFHFYNKQACVSEYKGATNCLDTDTEEKKLNFQIFASFICFLTLVLLVISACSYIAIAITLSKQKVFSPCSSQTNFTTDIYTTTESMMTLNTVVLRTNSENNFQRRARKLQRSISLTFVFFVASCISFSSWITTLVIISVMAFGIETNVFMGKAFTIVLRFHYIDNVINPVIYFVMCSKFRKHCKQLYKECFCKRLYM